MKRALVGASFVLLIFVATSSSAAQKKAPACAGPGQECKATADCCGSLNCLASRNPRESNKQRCY
jgi:hypothetical protein